MKRLYRNLIFFSLSGLFCLFLAIPANAQHRGGGGGGGHFGGGGGGHYSGGAARANGGGHYAAPARGGYASRGNAGARVGANYGGRVGANYGGRVGANYGARVGAGAYGRGGYGARGGFGGRGGFGYGARPYGYHGYGHWFGHNGWWFHGGLYASLYYPRIGFGIGFLPYGYYPFYWGDAEYYYSNGYYYNYDNNQYTVVEPPVGAVINTLPTNAQSIVINNQQYYELDGVYYLPITKSDGSLGYQIAGKDGQLDTADGQQPAGAQDVNPPAGGGYDQGNSAAPAPAPAEAPAPQANNGGGPQVGDLVPNLPPNSRGVTVNGVRLFVSPDDVYYKATRDNNNQKAYKVVGLPSEAPDNQ
jgi:hypothetical protein